MSTSNKPNKSPIQSPCILVCSIDQTSGYCYGCGRTSREIGNWVNFSDMERSAIMGELKERLDAMPKRRERRQTKRSRLKQT